MLENSPIPNRNRKRFSQEKLINQHFSNTLKENQIASTQEKIDSSLGLSSLNIDFDIVSNTLDEGIAIVENGVFSYCSQKFANDRGFQQIDLLNQEATSIWALMTLNTQHEFKQLLQESIESKRQKVTFKYTYKQQSINKTFKDNISFIYANNELVKMCFTSSDVTERQELSDEFNSFRNAVSTSGTSILITDTNLKITFVNKGFLDITEYKEKEVLGKTPSQVLFSGLTDKKVYNELLESIDKKLPWNGVLINKKANGEIHYCQSTISPLFNREELVGYVSLQHDITDQTNLKKEVERKTKFVDAILDHSPNLLVVKNRAREITYGNELFFEFIGESRSQAAGKRNSDFFSVEILAQMDQDESHVFNTGNHIINREQCVTLKDGKTFKWLLSSIIPLKIKNGQVERILVISKDITPLKLRENDLQSTLQLVNSQKEKFKEFAYLTAHNLRSQVTNLLGIVNLIEGETAMPIEESIPLLRKTSNSLLDTIAYIDNMLTLQQAERKTEQIWLLPLVNQAIDSLRPKIESSNTEIIVDVNSKVEVDHNMECLETTVYNLLSNAIKFRDFSRENKVKISFVKEGDQQQIIVEDNGQGLNTKMYTDRLLRLGQTFHNHPESRGAGLFIVRNHLQSYGSSIKFISEPNKGSKVVVTL